MRKYTDIIMSNNEPAVHNVLWLRPLNNTAPGLDGHIDKGYSLWYYNNGTWNHVTDHDIRKDLIDFINDLRSQIEELTETVDTLLSNVEVLSTKCTTLEATVAENNNSINLLAGRVSALENS